MSAFQIMIVLVFFVACAKVILSAVCKRSAGGLIQSRRSGDWITFFRKKEPIFWSAFGRRMLEAAEIEAAGREPLKAFVVEPAPEGQQPFAYHPQAIIIRTREGKLKRYSGAYFQKSA